MHWMPGRLRSTIVASNSSRVLNEVNTGSKSRSVTISVWLSGHLFALKFIGFGRASPGLKPRRVLSALRCVCICNIRPSLSVQLRNSYKYDKEGGSMNEILNHKSLRICLVGITISLTMAFLTFVQKPVQAKLENNIHASSF